MTNLAITFRAAQLLAHQFHHKTTGPTFLSDHPFLGELYGEYSEAYDSVIERMIGKKMPADLPSIGVKAAGAAAQFSAKYTDVHKWPSALLAIEEAICAEIDKVLATNPSNGIQNLLQGLADESEGRSYKLLQRSTP